MDSRSPPAVLQLVPTLSASLAAACQRGRLCAAGGAQPTPVTAPAPAGVPACWTAAAGLGRPRLRPGRARADTASSRPATTPARASTPSRRSSPSRKTRRTTAATGAAPAAARRSLTNAPAQPVSAASSAVISACRRSTMSAARRNMACLSAGGSPAQPGNAAAAAFNRTGRVRPGSGRDTGHDRATVGVEIVEQVVRADPFAADVLLVLAHQSSSLVVCPARGGWPVPGVPPRESVCPGLRAAAQGQARTTTTAISATRAISMYAR